ncbi:MAG: hypothetical protein AAB739_04430, partial [Patescibacteria group bacterium]
MEHQKNKIDNFEIAKPKNRGKSLTAISAGVAAAIISAVPENTNAQPIPVGEFGPEISEMMLEECGFDPPVGAAPISIGQGVKAERARLIFSGVADDCSIVPATEELEVLDDLNDGIVIRSLGKPIAMPNQQCGFIEVDRGDGRAAKIKDCGDGTIYKDGELKWDGNKLIDFGGEWGNGWTSGIDTIHVSQKPNHIKVVGFGPFYVKTWENNPPDFTDGLPFVDATTDVNINATNYYDAIQQSINDAWEKEGKDPYEAGLLNHVEDGAVMAPETDTLLLAAGAGMQNGKGGYYFFRHDPQTDEYLHLQRNDDGTYTLENPQIGEPDWQGITNAPIGGEFLPGQMVKVVTAGNRKIHLVTGVGSKIDWQWYHFSALVIGLEELNDEQGETYFKEVPITFEYTDQYPDDDEDGKVNYEDNCRWRANPDQVNTTADNYGDACKANC